VISADAAFRYENRKVKSFERSASHQTTSCPHNVVVKDDDLAPETVLRRASLMWPRPKRDASSRCTEWAASSSFKAIS